MAIVLVTDEYQVRIPASIWEQVGVAVGEALEVKAEHGTITLTPKSLADYVHEIAPPPPEMVAMWEDAKRKGLDTMTMEEIDEEIAAYRREKAQAEQQSER